MRNAPLVTVVTVTYNLLKSGRKEFFLQCLQSVCDQDHDNVEHLIIDGGSNDGTLDILKEHAKKRWVTYVSESDNGIYDAMNKGIKRTNGKYIVFLNSDDFYLRKDVLSRSVETLETENADFSYANHILIDGDRKKMFTGDIRKFLYVMPFAHQTMITKTSVLRKEGGFREKYGLPADQDLILRLILKDYKGVYVNMTMAGYRTGGVSWLTDSDDKIAQVQHDNFSQFYSFDCVCDVRRILRDLAFSYDFVNSFKAYAQKKNFKNINVDGVIAHFLDQIIEKCINCQRDLSRIRSSKLFRWHELVARSIKSPYKIMVFPLNFIRIMFSKNNLSEDFSKMKCSCKDSDHEK